MPIQARMLDSREAVKSLDQKGMFSSIEAMPKHISEGLRRGRMSGLPRFAPRDVFVCRVAVSAIGADLLAGWHSVSSEIRWLVTRSYAVPSFMGKQSFVIV